MNNASRGAGPLVINQFTMERPYSFHGVVRRQSVVILIYLSWFKHKYNLLCGMSGIPW